MAIPASEDTIDEVREVFRAYLKEKKHRITPERFMVLEEIYRGDGHFDADEIFFQMKDNESRVSRATVYNTLELLVECGLVQKQQFGKNQSVYERCYSFQQHDHLICQKCDAVLEFCDPRIYEIKTLMEKVHGFQIDGHSLHFYGECTNSENCTRKLDMEKKKAERLLKSE
ncbi:transcriptional repressor [bacterium]|nr:MAG: transcriptional repressor [bacterium]